MFSTCPPIYSLPVWITYKSSSRPKHFTVWGELNTGSIILSSRSINSLVSYLPSLFVFQLYNFQLCLVCRQSGLMHLCLVIQSAPTCLSLSRLFSLFLTSKCWWEPIKLYFVFYQLLVSFLTPQLLKYSFLLHLLGYFAVFLTASCPPASTPTWHTERGSPLTEAAQAALLHVHTKNVHTYKQAASTVLSAHTSRTNPTHTHTHIRPFELPYHPNVSVVSLRASQTKEVVEKKKKEQHRLLKSPFPLFC